MQIKNFDNISKIHFIGIGGISMSSLAKYCKRLGLLVSGSDRVESEVLEALKSLGITAYAGHSEVNLKGISPDIVVYTSAISEDNEELLYSKSKGIPLIKRSELLGEICKNFKTSIGVSGSHGKTTTTAMILHILKESGLSPTGFIGGEDSEFNNFLFGNSDYGVLECCEYKKNFLDIKPKISVVLNIDNDHLDTFSNIENECEAFSVFIKDSVAVINADDFNSGFLSRKSAVGFGIKNPAEYVAKNLREKDGKYSFTVYAYGKRLGRISLNVLGKHNVYNALSAVCVCDMLKIPFSVIKRAFSGFLGVKRRQEFIGEFNGKKVYADYAHHPKEILETLTCFENALVVFQPHTYSRTKLLMQDFIKVLSKINNLIVYKTYPAREKEDVYGNAYTLFCNIKGEGKFYADNKTELKNLLCELSKTAKTDKILFLGAGDIYDIAKGFMEK